MILAFADTPGRVTRREPLGMTAVLPDLDSDTGLLRSPLFRDDLRRR